MPNAYYCERKAAGQETSLPSMRVQARREELERRRVWLEEHPLVHPDMIRLRTPDMLITPQYAYGFFDGEGSIVSRRDGMDTWLHVTQVEETVLHSLRATFGGPPVRLHMAADGVRQDPWRWFLHGYAAVDFLRNAIPHLQVKQERTTQALDEWNCKQARKQNTRMSDDFYHPDMSDEHRLRREWWSQHGYEVWSPHRL